MGDGAGLEGYARGQATAEGASAQGAVQLHGDARGLSALGAHASQEDHRLAEKVAHEGRGGLLVQTAWRPDLLDASTVHHREAVGEAERFDLIVGDEEHGDAETALDYFDLPTHLLAELGVQVAEGLVEEEQ